MYDKPNMFWQSQYHMVYDTYGMGVLAQLFVRLTYDLTVPVYWEFMYVIYLRSESPNTTWSFRTARYVIYLWSDGPGTTGSFVWQSRYYWEFQYS